MGLFSEINSLLKELEDLNSGLQKDLNPKTKPEKVKKPKLDKPKCNHKRLSHYETIEGTHGTHYDDDGNVWFNNEYGKRVSESIVCGDCGKSWSIHKNSPKFIKEFHEKVWIDREKDMGIKH